MWIPAGPVSQHEMLTLQSLLTSIVISDIGHERTKPVLLDPVHFAVGRRLRCAGHFTIGVRCNVASDDWNRVDVGGAFSDELLVLFK